jgi:NADPH:quinone reductase-like Zn-dependent oxidoreductase
MRSYIANSGAGLAGLKLIDQDAPKPGPHEVLVRIRANSLNARELSVLRGTYPLPVKPDVVMVSDGAGDIVELGQGVTRVKVGDRVALSIFPRWFDGPFAWQTASQLGGSLDGTLTEFVAVSQDATIPIPDHLSFEEAAAFPCAGVTAWNALVGARPLYAGQTVLTLGSGGVSLFALQFAKLFGARVIATTSSDEKAAKLRALGADEVVNYNATPDWQVAVKALTGGRGVDHVIDVGGGTLEKSIKSVALEGQVAFIGRLAGGMSIDINVLFNAIATLRVVAAGHRAHFLAMNAAVAANALRPVIDRVFSFEDVPEAFRYYEAGKYFGKIVISHT